MPSVRSAVPGDAAAVAAVYAPYVEASVASFEDVAPDAVQTAERMAASLAWLVACEDGQVVGYAYATPHRDRAAYRWSVDVSVYLAPVAHRRGTGRALYERLLADLRARGFVNAYAGITLPNAASVGLHEALGFRQVARYPHVGFKHGAWHDVGWWALALVDPPARPSDPQR